MATFVSLKYQPLKQVLDIGSLEVVAAIWPEHTTGANTARSVVARYLADYFAMVHRGEAIGIKSLDHASAFRELVRLHTEFALEKGYNFDLSLTGTKMHTVAAAMLASTRTLANVWYSRPSGFNPETFTKGTGKTHLVLLKRVESVAAEAAG